jgi:hypothetical protein
MGNACCGKKRKKQEGAPTENIEEAPGGTGNKPTWTAETDLKQPDKQVETEPTEMAHSNITRKKPSRNQHKQNNPSVNNQKSSKSIEKETNVSKNDYSFAKITKTAGNQFSFEVYGEDISSLNPKFLLENLGNISHTSKINISRNELLLMTDENQEILRFLSANNITKQDLISGLHDNHINGSLALEGKLRIAPNFRPGKPLHYGL